MKQIYLDNGATSFPTAPGVGEAIKDFLENTGANINRSGYDGGFFTEQIVFKTRELLSELINFSPPENLIFSLNATAGLNLVLKGLLKKGDHCVVSSLEHNAVMRPLMQLAAQGVEFSRVQCDEQGQFLPAGLFLHLRSNTKAVVLTHASNVSGTILPLAEVGEICTKKNLYFIIDAAQTAGSVPIDFQKFRADALIFTGHKSLLGPQGVGGFAISPQLAETIEPLIAGGTGSFSEHEQQPSHLPDKFESGTLNIPGIVGLSSALEFLNQTGISAVRDKEMELTRILLEGFAGLKGVRLVGPQNTENRTAVVSVDCIGFDNAEVAHTLYKHHGIRTRCGLHCAPAAHKALGTFPQGTIRFSPGYFNTKKEMAYAISALKEVLATLTRKNGKQIS